ncbi:MAG: ester cyclase [Acidobacteria bacterium]|nr:ester cyclase [Acidobacteriota bacterium]
MCGWRFTRSFWTATGSGSTSKTFHGTHRGEFAGVAPTGKAVAIRVMDFVRVSDGKMREHWNVVDVAGLLGQLRS